MSDGFIILPNGEKRLVGEDLLDVLNRTTAEQFEAIATRLAEITQSKSREKHPLTIGLEVK